MNQLKVVHTVPKFLQQYSAMLEKKPPPSRKGTKGKEGEQFDAAEEEEFQRAAIATALSEAGVCTVWLSPFIILYSPPVFRNQTSADDTETLSRDLYVDFLSITMLLFHLL